MPKIIVIIPAYNSAQYITDALESVIRQSYQDFEIIVIDDGSTDNTSEIVKEYIDKCPIKIRYFYQENKGPGEARNIGIREAKGEYIAFLDADDIWLKDSLELRVKFLDMHPQVALVFSDYYVNGGKGEVIAGLPVFKKNIFLERYKNSIEFKSEDFIVFNSNFNMLYYEFTPRPIWTGTVTIKKEIFKEVGYFRTDIKIGEDNDLWARIANKHKVGFINRPLAIYNSNVSNSLTKNREKYYVDNLNNYLRLYTDKSLKKPLVRLIRKKIYKANFDLGYYYFSLYSFKKSKQHFWESVKMYPFQINSYIYLILSELPEKVIKFFKKLK